MYCGICGNKIESKTAFCPICGSSIADKESKKIAIDNKKVGKRVAIIIVVMIAVFGLKVHSYLKSIPTDQQLQSAVNNYQNGGIVASDGTWLYYNDNGLCRVHLKDGSKRNVISTDVVPEKMFSVGDSIYYYRNMENYKTKGNSGTEIDLDFGVFAQDCFQTDGKNYYVTGEGNSYDDGVCSVKVKDMKKSKQISDILPTKLLMYKDYIYVFSNFNTINSVDNENYGTWRIDKDGTNKIALMGFCPYYMVFSGDTIYYTNENGVICSMSLNGSHQKTFEGAYANGGLNVSDEYIFYLAYNSGNSNTTIHRMDKNGENDIELNQDDSSSINIVGDWIYYINGSYDDDIYKMSFDGEYNEPI